MSDDLTTPKAWSAAITGLVEVLRSALKPGQIEEIMSALGAGEWTLALEFLMDYIIDDEIVISSSTFTMIEALTHALHPRDGISFIKDLVLDMDE